MIDVPKAKAVAPPPGVKSGGGGSDSAGSPPAEGQTEKKVDVKAKIEQEGDASLDKSPTMQPGRSKPTDAKTPAPGPGGPQPEGKGMPPGGPPPGPMPGPSPELQKAQEILNNYLAGLLGQQPLDPNLGDELLNMPEGPDQLPDQMNRLIPKGTGNQRIGTIPAPNLPTGQMPNILRSANPGVQLVGGLPLEMVKGMQMKTGEESSPTGQPPSNAPAKKPPPGVKGKTPPVKEKGNVPPPPAK